MKINEKDYEEYIRLKRKEELRKYAYDFWDYLSRNIYILQSKYPPIIFTEKYIKDENGGVTTGVTSTYDSGNGNQICYIIITVKDEILDENIQGTIRHEILHLVLRYHGLKSDDNCAIFKILCENFDGGFYGCLDEVEEAIYNHSCSYINKAIDQVKRSNNIKMLNLKMLINEIGNVKYDALDKLNQLFHSINVLCEVIDMNSKTNL
ncbi:hypothetical protein [Anaerosporobacter sp.]